MSFVKPFTILILTFVSVSHSPDLATIFDHKFSEFCLTDAASQRGKHFNNLLASEAR